MFAHDSGLGQDTGCFLERCCRNEAVGRQGSFGNTQQHIFITCRLFAFSDGFLIGKHHIATLNLFASNKLCITSIHNVHTAQHLADDDFDVFIGNLHTLQAVNLLHLLNNVASQCFDTLQTQNVVWIYGTVYDGFTTVYHLTIVYQNLFLFRNQGFVCYTVYVGNNQTLFTFGFFTEGNGTGNFSQHTCIFRHACFKQFGYAWQTTGNIAGFRRRLRNTRQHITLTDFLTFTDGNHRTDRECHRNWGSRTRNANFQTIFIQQFDSRTQQFRSTRRTTFAVNHYQSRQTGYIVSLFRNGNTLFHVFEFHHTCVFGDHRTGMRIPSCQGLTGFNSFAVLYQQDCTVRYFVTFTFATDIVVNHYFTRTADDNQLAFVVGNVTHLAAETCCTVGFGFYLAGCCRTRCRTTDVERTHGQLSTWFTNGLCSNHTNCLTGVNEFTACQVATITVCTQAMTGFTSNWRTDFNLVNPRLVNDID